jgi:hypothetical protein
VGPVETSWKAKPKSSKRSMMSSAWNGSQMPPFLIRRAKALG